MKKGFTLIELLAVIVILAIIALIATPIILNIIEETKESANLRSAEMYLDAVELGVMRRVKTHSIPNGTYNVFEGGNICLEYTDTNCTDELKVEVDGEVPSTGSTVTITNGKIENVNLKYNNKTIVKNENGELVYKTTPCKKSADEDGYEMVTCGTESFYIMEKTEESIIMLAEYNLDVGYVSTKTNGSWVTTAIENPTGIQNSRALGEVFGANEHYGMIKFSTANYWFGEYDGTTGTFIYTVDSNYQEEGRLYPYVYGDYKDVSGNQQNIIYPYVSAYETHLKETLKVSSASAKLISYEQAINLKNNQGNPSWLYSTSYWFGSVSQASDEGMMIHSDGVLAFSGYCDDCINSYYAGVRPVVTISTTEVQ